MIDRTESMRQLVELALQSGRKRQNAQTGYVHYFHYPQDDEPHVTIPLVENFLFILALFKSRNIDNVNEAKGLLEKLLHFQNRSDTEIGLGNFPIYIHEYPACKDRFTAVQVSMSVYWILKLFHQYLGADLKRRLEISLSEMLTHMHKMHLEKPASYPTALKIGALCEAGGEMLQMKGLQSEGKSILDHLLTHPDPSSWYCPASLGAMLSALAIVYKNLKESPWSSLWKHLEQTWHQVAQCYMGPAIREWQDGKEPQTTLYDLFLSYYNGVFSNRVMRDTILHLEGVLIPSSEEMFTPVAYPASFESCSQNEKWHIDYDSRFACCFVEQGLEINPVYAKGFYPLRIVWGDHQRVHTLVCQGGNSRKAQFTDVPGGVDILFELGEVVESEDREKNREIIFFVDIHEDLEMLVSDHKATTFSLNDEIVLKSGGAQLSFKFELVEGEGRFLGHRMLGNRPSQIQLKGKQRYHAFDWQLFIRTIKRSETCAIKLSLRFE